MMEKQIEALFDDYSIRHAFSGAGLVKRGENAVFSRAYGYAHRGFQIPNTPETMFDTASVTKLFTAAAVLQLVDKGLLNLSDRITEIVELKGTKIPDDVTIRHLLTNTSGIADDADEEAGEAYEDLFIDKPNYSIRRNSDFLPQFAFKAPLFRAGTAVRYNNCAFVLLGMAIEQVTGRAYRDYVTDEIFNKCGMADTAFCAKDDADARVAEGYYLAATDGRGQPVWRKNIYAYPPIGTADGGAYSSVGDLDLFIRALVSGKLLSTHLTGEMLRPQVEIRKQSTAGFVLNGYGFHFAHDGSGKLSFFYKEGQNAGVAAMLAYYPDIDTTSMILANQTCDVWTLHRRVGELLLSKPRQAPSVTSANSAPTSAESSDGPTST
jgi:CubicO group peptidase (beta-lactamase class C family)